MAIRYHFDLYPRDDPRDGTLIVRFTKLQNAEYRGEANGTGSGRFSIRADTAEAQNIDPAGLQYVRVVREDTVAETEAVVGGFFLEQGDFTALDERGTRLLTFGGAGVLSYLSRSIMASHTYLSNDIDAGLGAFDDAMDPFDDTWRLYAQGFGDALGSMLWRVVKEASLAPSGAYTHRHKDGADYTDSHADDRPETAIPDLVMTFDQYVDSSSVAWTQTSGEFKAQVGENVLGVVRRLMESGLYVEMDPDTFELNAWEADTHRRTRTGTMWGATVVYFTRPSGDDIATANIKSDAKRRITAFIRRSWLLAGGQDIYADATGTADIPWEGHYSSDTADTTALADVAAVQIGARNDAGDVSDIRGRLGTDTSSGYYRPFEDAKLDDLVTVHTGTSSMDLNNQNFPIAAIRVSLRPGGDWDVWYELGSSYSSSSRQFQVSTAPAHTHPPNPELCRPSVIVPPVQVDAGFMSGAGSLTVNGVPGIPAGLVDSALYLFSFARHDDIHSGGDEWDNGNITATYDGVAMTKLGVIRHPDSDSGFAGAGASSIGVFRMLNPPSGVKTLSALAATGLERNGKVWVLLEDVSQTTPEADVQTNSGTSDTSSVTVSGGGLTIDAAYVYQLLTGTTVPVEGAGQTVIDARSAPTAGADEELGTSYGSDSPTWTFDDVDRKWVAAAVAINGSASMVGDVPQEIGCDSDVGTSIRASRCDHVHAHGDQSECDGTHHSADQISGLTTGAPDTADYLVGTAQGGLSAEIVVGTTPGGELGGTWASPTVDATHSGSAHHSENHASRHELGGADEIDVTGLPGAGGGGGGSGDAVLYYPVDVAPGSPDAQDEEFDTAFNVTPTFVSSSGTATSGAIIDTAFTGETGPTTNPRYNVDSDIPSCLVMQALTNTKFLAYWPFSPTTGTEWCVMAKIVVLGPRLLVGDDRVVLGVSAAAPTTAANEVTNSINAEMRLSPGFNHSGLTSGARHNESVVGQGVLYGAISGRTDNSITVYTATNGWDWRRRHRITSGTSPAGALVNYVFVNILDFNGAPGLIAAVDWIRYSDTDANPLAMVF